MNFSRRHWLFGWLSLLSACAQDPGTDAFPAEERLGGLRLGLSARQLTALLGQPESQGRDVEWAATGDWVQSWHYPKQGLRLDMASTSQGGEKAVLSITATPPCPLATARGIRLGSTAAEVTQAYGDVQDREQSEPDRSFVAGSVYGGVIFTFTDGKVSQIFIGAAAE